MKRGLFGVVVVAAICVSLLLPSMALAVDDGGALYYWTPRGRAPLTGYTTVRVASPDGGAPKRVFYASNRYTQFFDDNRGRTRISRNTFFARCPDYMGTLAEGRGVWVYFDWTWKRRANGTRYRYLRSMHFQYAD